MTWNVWSMGLLKNVFLHNDLPKTIYMHLPPGYACPPKHVCKLKESFYSLKQAPRVQVLISHFTSRFLSKSQWQLPLYSLYITRLYHSFLIYVDDMIINSNDTAGIEDLKTHLMHAFQMKDLGSLKYFLRYLKEQGRYSCYPNQVCRWFNQVCSSQWCKNIWYTSWAQC